MHTIYATNVNHALAEGLMYLRAMGVREESRNGPVLVAPEPVTTVYRFPEERVLFSPLRDANPFFHLMEALWMLHGSSDIAWPCYFNARFKDYSDDGVTQWAAYGRRWRSWFGRDQLADLIMDLKQDRHTRRAVLTMWDATSDPGKARSGGRDVPCNTHAYFDLRNDALNMTVCCRSNDVWWGAYGANAVHFSILQEYIATAVGVPVGNYYQVSNNFHLYVNVVPEGDLYKLAVDAESHDYYRKTDVDAYPLYADWTRLGDFTNDLHDFLYYPLKATAEYTTDFFRHVASPMYRAWYVRKDKINDGLPAVAQIEAPDWRLACEEWIRRREAKKEQAKINEKLI